MREPSKHLEVLPPVPRDVVRVQGVRELDVAVRVEPPDELLALVLQVRLDGEIREGLRALVGVSHRVEVDVRRRLPHVRVLRAALTGPEAHDGPGEPLIHRSRRAVAQHRHHPARRQPGFRLIVRVVIPAFVLGVRHDAEPLRLAYADRPIRVPPAPGDEDQLRDKVRVRRAPLQREHAAHASADGHPQVLHAEVVQQLTLQPDVITYRDWGWEVRGVPLTVGLGGVRGDRRGRSVRAPQVVAAHDEIALGVQTALVAGSQELAPPLVHVAVGR